MVIHVVQEGDTIASIAENYGVSPSIVILNNQLDSDQSLVVGQTIVILFPSETHTVTEGETLESIANDYGITVINLLQNNPYLANAAFIYPGQVLVIRYEENKIGNISINGYAYPFINREVLIQTLPYLTYLTLFTYGFTESGELIDIDDRELIDIARNYGVAPLMLISTLTDEGTFSNQLAHVILNDMEAQNNLIDNILINLREKNYFGLDIDFEYILPEDRQAYVDFIRNVTTRLNAEGYPVMTALAPKTSSDQPGLLYEAHDYAGIGEAANWVLLMTYEWGYTYGPPMAVSPINKVREVLDYAVTVIEPSKIFMGIPNYGYNFILPYERGVSRANSIGNVEAVNLAREVGASIQFDETAMSPFFTYVDDQGRTHEVWFEDARSIDAKVRLVPEYGFKGVSYWNIMKYFPQNWLVVNALFNIDKEL